MHKLLDLIMPLGISCLQCEKELQYNEAKNFFCDDCIGEMLIQGNRCVKCDRPVDPVADQLMLYRQKCKSCQEQFYHFERHLSCSVYDASIKRMLLGLKYKQRTEYIAGMSRIMSDRLLKEDLASEIDFIIPVPIHFSRRLVRGFNQSELLAAQISEITRIEYRRKAIIRCKRTNKLKNLHKDARKKMLKDAIIISKDYKEELNDSVVLIIDDIFTTGTTLNECAKILYENGVKKIFCLTFAMGI